MTQMTVNKLLDLCKKEIEKGNGDKHIVISDDNEGKDRDREIELGEDPTELAIIYGEDYYLLEDRLLSL